MSTIKVDTIATRTGSGNITVSNNIAGGGTISGTNITASGTLGVTGNTTMGGTAAITGNTTIGGTLVNTGLITAPAGIALGGGPYAAANTLDDYEEGTWVPVIKSSSSGSALTYSSDYEFRLPGLNSSTNALPYTKIGNRVFITFSVWFNSSATQRFNINLPFAYDGSEYGICGSATAYSIAQAAGLGILGAGNGGSSFDTYVIAENGGHSNVPYTASSEVYYFINYQTP